MAALNALFDKRRLALTRAKFRAWWDGSAFNEETALAEIEASLAAANDEVGGADDELFDLPPFEPSARLIALSTLWGDDRIRPGDYTADKLEPARIGLAPDGVLALLGPGHLGPVAAVAAAHPGKIEVFEWREETFEALIDSYNAGSRNIEQLFAELIKLSQSLDEEQSRHVRENLSEEELVIFDILTRPAPTLSSAERAEVKKVAKELLKRLRLLLVLNWRQKSAARSALQIAIEDALDAGLPPPYTKELYQKKCAALFEHVFESYPDRNRSIYSDVA